MEDIQPFKSSLWEFYITHHWRVWFLHKDKEGHKEPLDGRLSLRRAAACVFADSSKASRSCGHCCAQRTPLLIPRQNTDRKLLIFFFFIHRGEKMIFLNATSKLNPLLWCGEFFGLIFRVVQSSLWAQGDRPPSIVPVPGKLSYFIDVSCSWSRRCCLHLGRVVFVLREEEGLLMQRNEDLPDKFFSQVTK